MSAVAHDAVPDDEPTALGAHDVEAENLLRAAVEEMSRRLRGEGGLVIRAGDEGETLAFLDGFDGAGAALVPDV